MSISRKTDKRGVTLKAIWLILLFICSTAHAQIWGIDELGAGRYPQQLIEHHPEGFAVGAFTQRELFGDPLPAIERLIKIKRIPLIRYNLRWSDTHTFRKSDFPKIIEEAKRVSKFAAWHVDVGCQISGATEHMLNAADANLLARQVLAVIPERCSYVNNPWEGKGAFIAPGDRILNEVHGVNARPPKVGGRYNFSFDGSSAVDSDVEALKQRFSGASVFFLWHPSNNGRLTVSDTTPRPQRKAWPTKELLESLVYLTTNRGPSNLPANWLLKSHADRHNTPPEPRAYKPVFIVPKGIKSIKLIKDGKTYATSNPQPFVDGRSRIYVPHFGYTIGANTAVIANGKRVGVCNPGFRAGNFR